MVAAASFLIGFILVGLAVVLVAMRGGSRGARDSAQPQGPRGRSIGTWLLAGVCLLFGIAIPAAVMASNSDEDQQARGGVELTSAQAEGRQLFVYNCGTCHVLKAANTSGRVGPSLDQLRPPKALTLDAIEKGRARGEGQMPADLLQGRDAERVAAYVEAVAGR